MMQAGVPVFLRECLDGSFFCESFGFGHDRDSWFADFSCANLLGWDLSG